MNARILALSSVLAVFAPGMISSATAGDDQPLRIDFVFKFNVRYGPTAIAPSNLEPWYLWWPADANETLTQHDFQSSPYPGWPVNQPHVAGHRPQGPITYATPTAPYQPVSYVPVQVPSYWYGR